MAGTRGMRGDDPAEQSALTWAVSIGATLLTFALAAHFIPMGSLFLGGAPKGGAGFNQLTVAQFLGGVGGGIGAVIVGATLWLQLRALRELRRISQISHQFEAYGLWRALDDSLDKPTLAAVANVLSALMVAIRDDVILDPEVDVETILNQRLYGDDVGDGTMIVTRTAKPADIELWNLFSSVRAKVTAEFEAVDVTTGKTTDIVTLNKSYPIETVARILSGLGFGETIKSRRRPALLSGEALADDDVRRTRHFANRFIMHLDEAETLDCAAQCVALVSDPAVRQYLDLLVRIRSNPAARSILETYVQRDAEGRVENLLVGSVIWNADDVRSWQARGGEAGRS